MIEILAPAGNIDNLKVAVASGANAVYLGSKSFNARAKAGNFDTEELKSAVQYCHVFGVKVYLTINTMIKQSELPAVFELIRSATLCNVDAFIVSDLGLISLIKSATDVPVHLSTQAGVNNLEGAIQAHKLGVDRVILARETDIEEIKRIKNALPDLELECFVHGALCIGFSGQCLLSSSRNGDSGNRGRCRQLCRVKYSSSFGKTGYLLSARDICLFDEVKQLINTGICSFKIEGRLKSPEYVGSVVSAYKKAISGCLSEYDKALTSLAFNRSNGVAYLHGANDGIIDSTIQNHRGISIGKVVKAEKSKEFNKITFEINKNAKFQPQKGDGIKILTKGGEEVGGGEIAEIKGNFATIYTSARANQGDVVALTKSDGAFSAVVALKKKDIDLKFVAKLGSPVQIQVSDGKTTVEYVSALLPDVASKIPLDFVSVEKQLKKTGDTEFVARNIDVVLDDGLFIPVSTLNELRRAAIAQFRAAVIAQYTKAFKEDFVPDFGVGQPIFEKGNVCVVHEKNQFIDGMFDMFETVVLSPKNYFDGEFDVLLAECMSKMQDCTKTKIFVEIPSILCGNDTKVLCKTIEKYKTSIYGLLINNLSGLTIAQDFDLPVIYGVSFNIANNLFPLNGARVCSSELSERELKDVGGLVFAEGCLPLMRFRHCPVKANTGCNCANCRYNGTIIYEDGKYSFPIERTKVANCSFLLYNSVRTSLSGKVSPKGLFMDFYGYSAEEIKETIRYYKDKVAKIGCTSQYFKNGVL